MMLKKREVANYSSKSALWILIMISSMQLFGQNITVIGVGRLGICIALSLEKAGYNVLGVDLSPEYVEKINTKKLKNPEPFVEEYLQKSVNFKATTSLAEGLAFSDVCFVTVSTTLGTDNYNLKPLTDLLSSINTLKVTNKHIIINSTVLPGFTKKNLSLLNDCSDVVISYNPPFIAQGAIIQGLNYPDMVLIGQGSPEAGDILENIHKTVCSNNSFLVRMSVESAEIAKLSLNCFITMKIAFANLVADIAEETPGADKSALLAAIGKDKRIGEKCLLPGYGFGGPCFPRDNRALGEYAQSLGLPSLPFRATDETNRLHAEYMAEKLLAKNKEEYLFEDVSYKPNSPVKILQESQKLAVAKIIADTGKKVIIVDSGDVIAELQEKFGNCFVYKEVKKNDVEGALGEEG